MLSVTGVVVILVVLLVLFGLGIPIFLSFLSISIVAVFFILGGSHAFGLFANSIYQTVTSQSLLTIPMFILLGELLFRSQAIDLLLSSVDTLLGRVKGRQYVLATLLSVVFAALSGAAMGVAAMMGRSLLPSMCAKGYDKQLSTGLILAGASLAPIIPPSIIVIVIGSLAEVSIAKLLIAGVIPGLILAAAFIGYMFVRLSLNPALAPTEEPFSRPTAKQAGLAVARMLPFVLIIVSVMGFILMGIATPTESAATGVIGALVTAAIFRRLSWTMIRESLISAAQVTTMIVIIMACANLFSQALAFTGGARALTESILGFGLGRWALLLVMMLLPFVLCMFIDQIALMLILIPIYKPLIVGAGFDPIWFWLLILINITLGGITPPFGYTMFALNGSTNLVSLSDIYRAVYPFVIIFLAVMVLIAVFPQLATFLPSLL